MEIAIINTSTDPRYLKKYVLDVFLSKNITVTVIDSNITDKTSASDILNEVTLWSKFDYFFVYNAKLFKTLTKVRKSSDYIGHVLDIGNNQHIVYSPNPNTVFTNPKIIINSINTAIEALCAHLTNTYTQPGMDIIHYEYYPTTPKEIELALQDLLKRNVPLTIDIETFSLKHYSSGIATVTLCWSQHEGIAFPIDGEINTYQVVQDNKTISVAKNELIETPSGEIMTMEDYYNGIYQNTKRNIS